jgi:hypothetical protein
MRKGDGQTGVLSRCKSTVFLSRRPWRKAADAPQRHGRRRGHEASLDSPVPAMVIDHGRPWSIVVA